MISTPPDSTQTIAVSGYRCIDERESSDQVQTTFRYPDRPAAVHR
ncbi:hypothetical protein ACF08B_38800 [Streptomyces sp. NPDC015139]